LLKKRKEAFGYLLKKRKKKKPNLFAKEKERTFGYL